MKKAIAFLFLSVITYFSFAIPNIKLYEGGSLKCTITDNEIFDSDNHHIYTIINGKLYAASLDSEDNLEPLLIYEKDDSIVIEETIGEKFFYREIYSKKTGMLVFKQYESSIYEYDESTGVIIKDSFYENGILIFYNIYSWKGQQLQSTNHYLADGKIEQKTDYLYDSKTNKRIKEIHFDANGNMTCTIENDPQTGKIIKKYEYNQDQSLKSLTLYEDEKPTEKLVFVNGVKEGVKKTFISLSDDKKYILSDDFYITQSNYTSYSAVRDCEENNQNKLIDWDKNHAASLKKYNFSSKDIAYNLIQELKEKKLLIPFFDIELHKRNSESFFYFKTEDDEIDISSCYKIEISKKTNKFFAAMNKSDKNSGPFGFDIGMTYEEVKVACGGSEPEYISDDRYYVKPKKAHPTFEKYIVWISREYGLYYIKAISYDIHTSNYGIEVKNRFKDILNPLESKYGTFKKNDTIDKDYMFNDEQYWMTALKDGARTYSASWYTLKPENYNGLESIGLGIKCSNTYSTDEAFIWLEYGFTNYDIAQEALDDVL